MQGVRPFLVFYGAICIHQQTATAIFIPVQYCHFSCALSSPHNPKQFSMWSEVLLNPSSHTVSRQINDVTTAGTNGRKSKCRVGRPMFEEGNIIALLDGLASSHVTQDAALGRYWICFRREVMPTTRPRQIKVTLYPPTSAYYYVCRISMKTSGGHSEIRLLAVDSGSIAITIALPSLCGVEVTVLTVAILRKGVGSPSGSSRRRRRFRSC